MAVASERHSDADREEPSTRPRCEVSGLLQRQLGFQAKALCVDRLASDGLFEGDDQVDLDSCLRMAARSRYTEADRGSAPGGFR